MAKQLKVENGFFEANGKKIYELGSLSVARYIALDDLKQRLLFGDEIARFHSTLKDCFDLGNKLQIADSYKRLGNLIDAVEDRIQSKGQVPMLLIATLWLCEEGADPAQWSESKAAEMIDDIAKEGYDVVHFFHLASAKMKSFADKLSGLQE